jgi:protein-L-isoaspartate(D-aspartate) O-methyltransferase
LWNEAFFMTNQIHPGIERMLHDIRWETLETRSWIGKSELDPRVLEAMRRVPRHAFVPRSQEDCAYDNGPLQIGHGQTISQPYIVALMSDLLATQAHHVVLEVGCGSGYQSAVLAQLVKQVYSLEIVPELAQAAQERLLNHVRHGDGYQGWPEHAPFDGIIVTAAAPEIPPPLVAQLKPGGRMVIPVGPPHAHQELMLLEKSVNNEVTIRNILPVAFVPLTGIHGALDE